MSEADHNDSLISEWLVEYKQILEAYNISDKTRLNRSSSVKWIASELGSFQIGHIKPYEIALRLKLVFKQYPQKAKRLQLLTYYACNQTLSSAEFFSSRL